MTELQPAMLQGIPATRRSNFRGDINGLRAIAASAVVLFHFGVPGFAGGFTGVDMFFVVSGLLMTQIIEGGLQRRRFSLLGFYAARVRRIVPAIAICCLGVLLYGLIFVDPLALERTAGNSLSTMVFLSNVQYALQGSYFADAAATNWMLHTWTLSVEWQFYMLYPIVLLLASRWHWLWERRLAVSIIATLLLFGGSMIFAGMAAKYRDLAFYLLPTRAWEMLSGGCIAFLVPKLQEIRHRRALALAGLALVVASILLIDESLPWPSPWLLAPVAGTLLLLIADDRDAGWAALPPVKTLGLWSYSLYLWHWPVVAAFHYHGIEPGLASSAAGVALSIALGGLSYTLVETRLRDVILGAGKTTPRSRWLIFWLGWLAILGLNVAVLQTHGFAGARTAALPQPTQAALADYSTAINDWKGMDPCHPKRLGLGKICEIGPKAGQPVMMIGDSHAEEMVPRLMESAPAANIHLTLARYQGCPPVPGLRWTINGQECANFAERALRVAEEQKPHRLVLFAAWTLYFAPDAEGSIKPHRFCAPELLRCRPLHSEEEAWQAIDKGFDALGTRLETLRREGTEIVLVLPQPVPPQGEPRSLYQQSFHTGHPAVAAPIDTQAYRARTQRLRGLFSALAARTGARVIDPLDSQCPSGRCPVVIDRHYMFKDTHHVRASLIDDPRFGWIDQALSGR